MINLLVYQVGELQLRYAYPVVAMCIKRFRDCTGVDGSHRSGARESLECNYIWSYNHSVEMIRARLILIYRCKPWTRQTPSWSGSKRKGGRKAMTSRTPCGSDTAPSQERNRGERQNQTRQSPSRLKPGKKEGLQAHLRCALLWPKELMSRTRRIGSSGTKPRTSKHSETRIRFC